MKRTTEANSVLWYLIFFTALGLFTIISLAQIQKSVTYDELTHFMAAKNLHATGIARRFDSPERIFAFSPHLHLGSMALMFSVFGENEAAARLPGVVSGLLAITLVFIITKSFSRGGQIAGVQWASVSSLLYASTPALIQGSVIIDIDTTVLIPAILFLYWSFAKYEQGKHIRWAILTGLAMMVALWGRVTTPPILAFCLIVYALLSKNGSRWKLIAIGGILSGVLLFLLSWYAYCRATSVPFSGPFRYSLDQFLSRAQSSGGLTVFQVAQNTIYFVLWVGVFPLLLVLVVVRQRCAELFRGSDICLEDFLLLGGFILTVGYTFIGGATFGYPKYQSPAIPLIYIFAGIGLSGFQSDILSRRLGWIVIVTSAAFLIQTLMIGDLLYLFRYALRESMAFVMPPFDEILRKIAAKVILLVAVCGMLVVASLRSSVRENMVGLVIAFALGSNIGMSFLQMTAGYRTGYNYGEEGTAAVVRYIRDAVPAESVVIAPSEIIYYLRLPNSKHVSNALWTDAEELRRYLADQHTSAFVYSVPTNSVGQIRTIRTSRPIQKLLHQNYEQIRMGTYTIWLRRKDVDL